MNDHSIYNNVESFIRKHADSEVPYELTERLQSRLTCFREKLVHHEKRDHKGLFRFDLNLGFLFLKFRLALVAAALIGIILLGTSDVFQPPSANLYAAVIDQLKNFRTISYSLKIADGAELRFTYQASEIMRISASWGLDIIADKSKKTKIVIFHYMKKYLIENDTTDIYFDDMRLDDLRNLPSKADEKLGQDVIEGKKLVGFRSRQGDHYVDVWVDPDDEQIGYVSINFFSDGKLVHKMEFKDFKINDPDELAPLMMTPPKGYEQILTE